MLRGDYSTKCRYTSASKINITVGYGISTFNVSYSISTHTSTNGLKGRRCSCIKFFSFNCLKGTSYAIIYFFIIIVIGTVNYYRHGVNIGLSTTLISFNSKGYFVHLTHTHSSALPCLKVITYRYGSACTLRCTHTPILLEGCSTFDGWLIFTSCFINIIGTSINCNSTL